jgi:hypothetical protein
MALEMSTKIKAKKKAIRLVTKTGDAECPLRKPARHVKKSLLTIYMTIMMDVFSHSSWNGW